MTATDGSSLHLSGYGHGHPTPEEHLNVEMLLSLMGPGCDYDTALRVLRRSGGNVDNAAGALLEENAASEEVIPRTPPPSKPERGSPSVIDLTGNDELSRAVAASLQDQQPTFGPSNRAPDPNWAVVPTNVATGAESGHLSQEEQHMNQAIEASLTYQATDNYDELPLEERIREGDRPVSLRPTKASYVYAGLIIQGLFFVPQVRRAIALYRPTPDDLDETDLSAQVDILPPRSGPAHTVWSLLEAFVNMDLARLSELNIDESLPAFDPEQWSSPTELPGDLAFRFYSNLTWSIETVLDDTEGEFAASSRLFHFRYGYSDAELVHGPLDKRCDMSIVRVSVPGTPHANDLLSCLFSELSGGDTELGKQQVIFEPSSVVAFQLNRTHASNSGKSERAIFKYPKNIYLDQFLRENAEYAADKRRAQKKLFEEIEQLKKKREVLTKHNGREVVSDLRSVLYYYEHVAEDRDNAERKKNNNDIALRLRKILTKVEIELQTIDATIAKHQLEATTTYDCPELQKHRYDLRFVVVHDGFYGRNRLYSYLKQRDVWWKTVDYTVTQVTEDVVLNDSVGLHLNAGPFFLVYSRTVPPEDEIARSPWPESTKDSVKHNNMRFFRGLAPEVQARAEDPNSPPLTPVASLSHVPSDVSSGIVEPPSPRDDLMDVTAG